MGTVPDAYHHYIMHYGAYYYVVTADITVNAAAGQKEVTVEDGTEFEEDSP